MNTLTQKDHFQTFEFTIDDAGLLKKIRLKHGESEFHTPFEKITGNKIYIVQDSKLAMVLGVGFAILSLILFISSFSDKDIEKAAAPIWLAASLISFLVYVKTKKRKLFLNTSENQTIEFYNNKPSREEVDAFIKELIAQRNDYLNTKYGQPSKRLEFGQQIDNFNWLLNTRVISRGEYDEKVNTLNAMFNITPGDNKIGFSKK